MSLSAGAQYLLGLARGGSYSAARDALKHRLYDSWIVPSTVQDHDYFTQPIGSAWGAGVKSIIETNLKNSGTLPNGQVFLATRFAVHMLSFADHDAAISQQVIQAFINMMHTSVFEIKIEGREWDYQIHGSELLPTLAIAGTAAAANQSSYGQVVASGWSRLDPTPIVIDQLVTFSVKQRLSNPIAAVVTTVNNGMAVLDGIDSVIKVTLEGMLTRAK